MISEAIGSLATLVALAVTWVYLGQNGNPVPSPAPASVQSAHANPEPGNDDPEAADDSDSVDCEAADDEWQAGFDASPLAPKRETTPIDPEVRQEYYRRMSRLEPLPAPDFTRA